MVLVIVDYATRYPEAFAITSITAPAVTEKLIEFLTDMDSHKRFLSDQGPNFMSELLKEVYAAIGVKPL